MCLTLTFSLSLYPHHDAAPEPDPDADLRCVLPQRHALETADATYSNLNVRLSKDA